MFDLWFETAESDSGKVRVLNERKGGRESVFESVIATVADHLVDLEVIESMGGFKKSAEFIRSRLPEGKKSRSGDLGEILATEFVAQKSKFAVPLKRLRYKDDRNLAMRGDDALTTDPVVSTQLKLKRTPMNSFNENSFGTLISAPPLDLTSRFNVRFCCQVFKRV